VAISGVLLITWRTHLTFFIDDWDLLLHRRGFSADAFLDPHARHLIAGPAVLWKAIQATFGMDSQLPYAIASTTFFLASVVLLYVYLRARVGEWLALAAVVPILFMGTAYEDLLNVFQICYFGSMAFGLGALLLFERRDTRGDVLACLLLLASLAFAEIAFAFAAACAVALVLDRGPWRRIWVVLVPAVVYLLWYIGWGETGSSTLSFENVATSPAYILDGFASSLASLFGFGTPILLGGNGGLDWGRPLLVALGAVAAWGLAKRPEGRSRVLIPLAAGLAFWLLTAANLSTLHEAYDAYRRATALVRGDLAGLEIARDRVDPGFVLTPENSGFEYFGYVEAGLYLSAAEKFGSPAYSETELAAASEDGRAAADKVLAAALPISLKPVGATPATLCRTLTPAGGTPPVISLPPGGAVLRPGRGVTAELGLRRYASASFPVHVATLRGAARLDIPRDRSGRPWELQVRANGKVTVCGQ
jgi:hypothetical protein